MERMPASGGAWVSRSGMIILCLRRKMFLTCESPLDFAIFANRYLAEEAEAIIPRNCLAVGMIARVPGSNMIHPMLHR